MKKQIFYRNHHAASQDSLTKLKSIRMSVDDLRISPTKPFHESKKGNKRHSNDHFSSLKEERQTFKKSHLKLSGTASNSVLISKNQSPLKMSFNKDKSFAAPLSKLKNYKFYYQIGFGGFGRVWKVSDRSSLKEYAMKQISKRKVISKNNMESVVSERKILSELKHGFLINIRESFQDEDNLYLVMDYLRGGDLRYQLCYKERFSEKEIKFIIACIIIGLAYVHSKQVIHKDIKPENIVFEENGYVRITDFGIAKWNSEDQSAPKSQSSGTPVYMAPEILFKNSYSFESDFYAVGVIAYELLLGKRPYDGKNRADIREQLLTKNNQIDPSNTPFNPNLVDLINQLLEKNPANRLGKQGIKDIQSHPFFSDFKWKLLERKEIKPPFIPNVVCESKIYLDEIAMFNEINKENERHTMAIERSLNDKFKEYDFCPDKPKKEKGVVKRMRRASQNKKHS